MTVRTDGPFAGVLAGVDWELVVIECRASPDTGLMAGLAGFREASGNMVGTCDGLVFTGVT